MKVAFASKTGKLVDTHFGKCESFSIFEISENEYRWVEAREIGCSCGENESDSNKTEKRVDAIKDCTLLFINQIGPAAAARVTRTGIMPLKVEEGTPIVGQLERLLELLRNKPPVWLVKALRKSESTDEQVEA